MESEKNIVQVLSNFPFGSWSSAKVVGLLNEGKTIDEIKQMNKDQNIFGAPTAERSEKIFNTVAARIGCLAPSSIRFS